jgi:hypothetical protein
MAEESADKPLERLLKEPTESARLIRDVATRSWAICRPLSFDRFKQTTGDALEAYRIALISCRVIIKVGKKSFPVRAKPDEISVLQSREFDHFDICVPDVSDDNHVASIEAWCDFIRSRCELAVANKAKFIVFNELSYPNFWPGRPLDVGAREKRRELDALRVKLDGDLQRIATEEQVVIISGSYHDTYTFENICYIYFPENKYSCTHKKLTSARAVGEHVNLPRGVQYPIYNWNGLAFSVLICSDAYDLNIFFRQLLRPTCHPDAQPFIFFVPSYHVVKPKKPHHLVDACKQLSEATGSVVVFVNQKIDKQSNVAFFAGEKRPLQVIDDIAYVDVDHVAVKECQLKTASLRDELDAIFTH